MFDSVVDDFKNAWNKPNNEHVQLIIVNAMAFVALGLTALFVEKGLLVEAVALPSDPSKIIYKPWTLITYMFTHFGLWHILMNMLMLYWFGRIIANFLGGAKNVVLYVLGGFGGAALYVLLYQIVPSFADRAAISVLFGASAGVTAIIVGAATLTPNSTMFLMFIGPVKIKHIAGVLVMLSIFQSTGSNAGGEISHLGGALMGFIYVKQLQSGNDIGSWVLSVLAFFKSFFVRQPKIKVTYKAPPKTKTKSSSSTKKSGGFFKKSEAAKEPAPKTSQEEIDAILDKISQSGYENLSKEEKQKLFEASKK